jgi:DNA topoisomerase-1
VNIREKESQKITNLGDVPEEFPCPLCGAGMVYKLGRTGKFMSCNMYPACNGTRTLEGALVEPEKPIGIYPDTGEPIYVMDGKFGPYVQVGDPKVAKENGKKKKTKPKRASLPKGKDSTAVTLEDALIYLSLPRLLGINPDTGDTVTASVGRFGPYIVHQTDFRSLKHDDVYTIELPRALEILREPKKPARGRFARKTK